MAGIGGLTRKGLQATSNAVQNKCWRPLPTLIGQQCGVSGSCVSLQAQPQLDVQDSQVDTAEARGSHGAVELGAIRTNWSREEVAAVYNTPLLDLVYKAASVHRMYNDPQMVQRCTLLSIKTGGCPETCNYCAQSSSWSKDVGLKAEKLMDLDSVYEAAVRAKEAGSTRFCMGAAWRGPTQVGKRQWERVLDMVGKIRGLNMEVCTTLGMLTPEQAAQLRTAGLTAYNHNLDTSPEYYPKVTSSRKYQDRLDTLQSVREAGISVCAGGIIGLGEGPKDRVGLIHQLATLPEHPESVPINALVAVAGTPMQDNKPPSATDIVRCVATARVTMPRSVVRLSAGRLNFSLSDQALCFMAGANSIFDGDKLLTTKNNERNADLQMFEELGLKSRPAFVPYPAGASSSNGQTLTEATAAQRLAAANQFATAATVDAIQQQAVAST